MPKDVTATVSKNWRRLFMSNSKEGVGRGIGCS
jgi:hypothetical protein